MVSGPTTDIFIEYQANDGKTLGIKRFVKDGVKMVTVNDIELTLDSLISMIVDVDVVEAPRLEEEEGSTESAESAEGSEESVEESESDSSFAEPDPDTDSDYEENDTHAQKDVMTQSQEDFKNLLSFIISIYVVIVSIIAGLIFTNIIR
jgi:hypothetical protein